MEVRPWKIENPEDAQGTVIFLHGYGSNAQDLFPIGQAWHETAPYWNYMGPNGVIPVGYGYSWFSLEGPNWQNGIFEAGEWVKQYCERLVSPFIFCGFSQGAFLAAHLALFTNLNSIGAICFSGGIVPQNMPIKKSSIHLIHGSNDNVILPNWYEKSMDYARQEKIEITGEMIEGMGHEINDEALASGIEKYSQFIKIKSQVH